jgi:hypothetical protein
VNQLPQPVAIFSKLLALPMVAISAGGNRANTRDLADTLAESILPIALLNLLVECSDDIEQVRHVVL